MELALGLEKPHRPRSGPGALRGLAATSAATAAAVLVGALYPLSASLVGPLAVPTLVVGVLLLVVSLHRPGFGVAVAFLLTAITPGLGASFLAGSASAGPEGPPVWIFGLAWTALLFVLLALRPGVAADRSAPALPPLALPMLVFGALALASFATSPAQGLGLPILRSAVTGILLFLVAAWSLRSEDDITMALRGTSLAAVLVGGLACLEHVRGASTSSGFITSTGALVGRVTAGFNTPNLLGGFLLVLVPLAFAAAVVDRRWRLVHLAGMVLAVGGVYASFSRGALLGLLLMPFLLVRGRWLLLFAPLAVLASGLVIPSVMIERFAVGNDDGAEIAGRRDIWSTAGEIWLERPLLGHGLGSFPGSYAAVRVSGKQFLENTQFEPPPHAHNLALQLLAEQGLVGFSAFGAVAATAGLAAARLRRSRQRRHAVLGAGLLAALVGLAVHNVFDVTLVENAGVQVWGILGILSAATALDRARGASGGH